LEQRNTHITTVLFETVQLHFLCDNESQSWLLIYHIYIYFPIQFSLLSHIQLIYNSCHETRLRCDYHFTLWSGAAHAQGSFGLKGGLNLAKQKAEFDGGSFTSDTRASFHVGGYFNYAFNDQFSLQPELFYNSIGAKVDDGDDIVFKFDYISLPIMVNGN
jgi:hypothetical protein